MDAKTIGLIVAVLTIILFVPFYPFKLLKKVILFLLNKFIPLPIKFDDIGGVPIIGMRLFKVRIKLGPSGTLEAEEMQMKVGFLRMLLLKRPHFNPIAFHRPVIHVSQSEVEKKGGVWFLFPINAVKQVLSVLFSNLTGLNVVRIYGGTIVIEGKRGNTTIKNFNGEFTSAGTVMKMKRLSCSVGNGTIDIQYPEKGPMLEGRVDVKDLHLQDLIALKVPKMLTGPVNVEAVMRGNLNDTEMLGYISSPSLFMRTEAILNFRSPLYFKDNQLTLEKMQGHIGEYQLTGKLETNVVTDVTDLYLQGGGRGRASGSILQMLNMKPFISYAGLEASIHLWGNLDEFTDINGDIKLDITDGEIDFAQLGEGTMAGFPLKPIPHTFLHMTMKDGNLKFEECRMSSKNLTISATGEIRMQFDEEADMVDRSQFDMDFNADCPDLQILANQFGMPSLNVEGSGTGNFTMYADYSTFFHELKGDGHLSFKNTRIKSIPVTKLNSLDGIVDMKIDSLEGDIYLVKDGMGFRNLECTADWLDVSAEGFLGFFTKEMDVKGDVSAISNIVRNRGIFKLLPGSGKIANSLRTKFSVTGKTGRPKVKVRLMDTIADVFSSLTGVQISRASKESPSLPEAVEERSEEKPTE